MSKFRIINLIDKLFISVCVFLVIYAWINFYIRDLWSTFIFSLVFSFAVLFILFYMLGKRQEKISTSKKENDKFNKTILAFRLTPKKEKYALIEKIISKGFETKLDNNKLTYIKNNRTHLIIISTHQDKLLESDIISIIDEYYTKNIDAIDIVCNEYLGNKTKFLKSLDINIINKKTLYNDYFSKFDTYPNLEILDENINKLKLKDIAKNMFQPSKAKSYFLCGLILIFSSIILPYHYYYLIFGSMFMLFSIICKLLPKFS